MKKGWFALSLLLAMAISAGAHSGDRVFPVYELTDEMLKQIDLHDGSIEEWSDLVGEPSMTMLDFIDDLGSESADPANLDFRIWLAWHDDPDRIYLAFICSDDMYKNTHDYSASFQAGSHILRLHDSILFAVDADHSGGEGVPRNTDDLDFWVENLGTTQQYEAIARTVSGPLLNDPGMLYQTGNFGWMVFPPYGDTGGGVYGENPTISVIELFVRPYDEWGGFHRGPEEAVFSDLAAGHTIGFALIVYDWDEEEWAIPWTPEEIQTPETDSDIIFLRADVFLDGLLLSADPTDLERGTAAESATWGRIKAALEME